MFYLIGPVFVITTLAAMSMGLVAYAYYTTLKCDPVSSGQILPNQVLKLLVNVNCNMAKRLAYTTGKGQTWLNRLNSCTTMQCLQVGRLCWRGFHASRVPFHAY